MYVDNLRFATSTDHQGDQKGLPRFPNVYRDKRIKTLIPCRLLREGFTRSVLHQPLNRRSRLGPLPQLDAGTRSFVKIAASCRNKRVRATARTLMTASIFPPLPRPSASLPLPFFIFSKRSSKNSVFEKIFLFLLAPLRQGPANRALSSHVRIA